jgi:hypothetical protein
LAVALHIRRYAQPGKSSEGEQNGKEDLKEGEEDPPDQAVDKAPRLRLPFLALQRARLGASHAGQVSRKRGLSPQGWRPFFLSILRLWEISIEAGAFILTSAN